MKTDYQHKLLKFVPTTVGCITMIAEPCTELKQEIKIHAVFQIATKNAVLKQAIVHYVLSRDTCSNAAVKTSYSAAFMTPTSFWCLSLS